MENQIWRKRVPIDRLEYWDQCGLTDPYRLLLAISAIGKDIFQVPWNKGLITKIEVMGELRIHSISKFGNISKDKLKSIGWTLSENRIIIKHNDFVFVVYHLLWLGCSRIEIKYHRIRCIMCGMNLPGEHLYFCIYNILNQ